VNTSAVGPTTPASTTDTSLSRNGGLGRDAFLQLLTTQLAHQDPTAPQADGEFIAQLAQFSSLEQLTQIQKTLQAISTALGVATDASQQETTTDTSQKA
jgi:flagellar basal-body rod modification protein FlgD